MTRDEQRKACIKAMEAAYDSAMHKNDTGRKADFHWLHKLSLTAAFDSLHGLARVCPIEATEEMVDMELAGFFAKASLIVAWRIMSAAGDLTNQPEKKP